MDPPESADPANPFSPGADSTEEEGPHEILVHGLKAKFFLNQPVTDLLPDRYLEKAENSPVKTKPWVFRNDVKYARDVSLKEWSKTNSRYRAVFKTLRRVPKFETSLWEGGCEDCQDELSQNRSHTQAQVVFALLSEIGEMLELKRLTADGKRSFFLMPRLMVYQLEYWTGYREKHRDAPDVDGIVSLDFEPGNNRVIPILPISVTNYAEPLEDNLADKFKLILGQLLQHVRPLPVPGDKVPDQEIFLIGQHGSKLHIMRTFFPGHKVSSLWCRSELPYTASAVPPMLTPSPPTPSPSSPEGTSTHIEHIEVNEAARSRSNSNRFYAAENIERVQRHLDAAKLNMLDHELDTRTFRVLCTREYDLWHEDDFAAAVKALVALHMYLLSGSAQCGALQAVFNKPPYPPENPEAENWENGRFADEIRRILEDWSREDRDVRNSRQEEWALLRQFELMQELTAGRRKCMQVMRRSWWDFVWDDLEGERLERIEGVEVSDEGEGDENEEGVQKEDEVEGGEHGEEMDES
ncbi:hypothetical protein PENSUB_8618 [Penicillium subrubescens]|uniref:Uncharacterized protein n=1 Tax=Penicillium subrubescens TaxID=1316194 RepID=A0A1Q5TG95_9EURO|nr:hypothetical protein PENSUB_8618 [Penicillium subrubescens]